VNVQGQLRRFCFSKRTTGWDYFHDKVKVL